MWVNFAVSYNDGVKKEGGVIAVTVTFEQPDGYNGGYHDVPLGLKRGAELFIRVSTNINLEVNACMGLVMAILAAARMTKAEIESDVYVVADSQKGISGSSLGLAVFVAYALRVKNEVPNESLKQSAFTGTVTSGSTGIEPELRAIDCFQEKALFCSRNGMTLFAPEKNVAADKEFCRELGVTTLAGYAKGADVPIVSVNSLNVLLQLLYKKKCPAENTEVTLSTACSLILFLLC